MSRARLARPAVCAVPGCGASSSHRADFVAVEFGAIEGLPAGRGWVCLRCLAGEVDGLSASAAAMARALGALHRAMLAHTAPRARAGAVLSRCALGACVAAPRRSCCAPLVIEVAA